MRLTGGIKKNRQLIVPKGKNIRPATDKLRLAVFNMLTGRQEIEGARALDLFCGSGAYGLEALSRGAASCVFVDKTLPAIEACRLNLAVLDLTAQASVLRRDAAKSLQIPDNFQPVTLIFMDPPYGQDLAAPALNMILEQSFTGAEGHVVLETGHNETVEIPPGFSVQKERIYGQSRVTLLRWGQAIAESKDIEMLEPLTSSSSRRRPG